MPQKFRFYSEGSSQAPAPSSSRVGFNSHLAPTLALPALAGLAALM